MRFFLPLAIFLVAASSCSTPYKSGQTPDDVYFSPARPEREYVRTEAREEVTVDRARYEEDRYLRLRVRNRARCTSIDDYYRDPYAYTYSGVNCNCGSNPRLYWNYYYTPAHPYAYYFPKTLPPNSPRKYNFDVNRPPSATPAPVMRYTGKTPVYQDRNEGSRGSSLRDVFNSGPNPSRTTPPPSSSSSSSSSGSSSGSKSNGNAGVRRF